MLLEKETVLGKELDELIFSLKPGIKLPSQKVEDDDEKPAEPGPEAATATQPDIDDSATKEQSDPPST
jgi:cell division protease FtsH